MEINQINWTGSGSEFQLTKGPDGSMTIVVDGNAITLKDRQAMLDLISACSSFDESMRVATVELNGPKPSDQSMQVNTDFPRKVRNAIFIMVGLGTTILLIDAVRQLT